MDKVTALRISLLHPSVRAEMAKIINECNKRLTGRSQVRISQGLRTDAEQTALYSIGRTTAGRKVTNAKAGQSIHNYGFAVDIVLIIDGKTASWDTKADWDADGIADWTECVQVFKQNGWTWGGDWTTFKDMPHFEKKGLTWRLLSTKKRDKENYVIL
ncbi:M15 family metallopeptidase [Epilithonimonas mollis]|uniref:Peptidoglycan L-alanyl-D-glutamate endopeptidase CwlK n=1 Tax=Epilithonimonas mollis TaxID=216903 RepID=A0A1M6UJV5_9FLAO|nr:M15 family metallopeptidase [Epilithonimonas mollis]SHK69449.1 peptidoglycan L-alanyl-D-glutamate endopeptidase CwlK [Epilithonimonas mollis]